MSKSLTRASLVAIMLLLEGAFFSASATPGSCSGGASLSGWYGLLVSGGGKYLSGAVDFDGNCNVSGGTVTGGSGGQYTTTSVAGAYGQNSDGSFTITLNFAGQSTPQTYMVGVSESGNKARGLESDSTVAATIDLQSQLTTLASGYSAASLNGKYAASCFGGSSSELNYLTFDGNGNLSGVDVYDHGGAQANNPMSGTYSVNGNGTFSGSLAGSYSFNGVIDNGVSEIEYIYDQAGTGGVMACVGKQSTSATANLLGYYGIVVGGPAQNGWGGKYLSGSVYFNGAGVLSATNLNGGINATYGNTTATGTYIVNADNTISITMNLAGQTTPQTYIVGISEAGNEAAGIETDGTAVATIDMQSQLQLPSTPYSTASLNGTYSASCGGSEVDLNYVTFDGNGNIIAGVDAYDDGGYGDNPYTGTYIVHSDGTFSGNFFGDIYDIFTMTGVLENGTAEMEYTYYQTGVGGVVACVGESTYGPIGTATAAATPTFSPVPGAYSLPQSVTLSDVPGAAIYYTTNGTTPTTNSPVYSTPIPLTATTTIQAIAVATGFNNSAIAAGTFFQQGTPTAATPTFNPAPGFYSLPQSITLSDTTPGALFYYTTDGTIPTTSSFVYSTPIPVSATTTIQAIAVATGYGNSGIASGIYSFIQSQTITFPTIPTQTYPAGPLTLNATASSGLPVGYAILSGPATVSGNIVTITGAGSVTVQASQAGNAQYAPASPVSQTFTVSQASTTLALSSSINPSSPGQLLAFAATITPQFGGQASGTVTLKDGSAILSIVSVSGNVATLATSALAIGTHSISAVYSGDANFTGSTSSPLAQVVAKAATTTTLVSSPNPSGSGKLVTFTATVTSPAGTLTGTVKFLNGATVLAAPTLKSGTAKYTTTKLPPGANGITAVYSGDINNSTSTSTPLSQFVLAATVTTLASSPNPSGYGQPVVLTANVSSSIGAPPDGETVTFKLGTAILGTGLVSGGTATFSTSTLGVGTKMVTAVYGGDPNLAASTSKADSQVIGKALTTTTLTSSQNPSGFGQPLTFTATVTPQFTGIPTGTVTFYDGAKGLGTVPLSAGVASFTTSILKSGTHSMTVKFNGSTSFIASSGSLTQAVD